MGETKEEMEKKIQDKIAKEIFELEQKVSENKGRFFRYFTTGKLNEREREIYHYAWIMGNEAAENDKKERKKV